MKHSSLAGHLVELVHFLHRTDHPADRIVSEFFRTRRYLGSHDRRFLAEALYGIIRRRRLIEWYFDRCCDKTALGKDPDPAVRYLAWFLIHETAVRSVPPDDLQGHYSSYWQTVAPHVPLHAFIDCILAERAALEHPSPAVTPGIRYSFPDWMVDRFRDRLGSSMELLLEEFNKTASVELRINTLKTNRERCREALEVEGIPCTPTPIAPCGLVAQRRFNRDSTKAFQEGWYEIQDQGSQLVSLFADPAPGSTVVDACAGAGGKTLHLAALMDNRGEIIAVDVDQRRLAELGRRSVRAGVTIIRPIVKECIGDHNLNARADLVMVDAPCTGSGTIRRNPWLKWSVTEETIARHAALQHDVLEESYHLVKPGGRIVYVTCSLFREENEEVVDRFLALHHDVHPVRPRCPAGIEPDPAGDPWIRLMPHIHKTDGFFVAVMERK